MLTRSQITCFSDFSASRFQNLVQRGFVDRLLDATDDPASARNEGKRVYRNRMRNYRPIDAVALRIFHDLSTGGGLTADLASFVGSSVGGLVRMNLDAILENRDEYWTGAAFFQPDGMAHFCKTLSG